MQPGPENKGRRSGASPVPITEGPLRLILSRALRHFGEGRGLWPPDSPILSSGAASSSAALVPRRTRRQVNRPHRPRSTAGRRWARWIGRPTCVRPSREGMIERPTSGMIVRARRSACGGAWASLQSSPGTASTPRPGRSTSRNERGRVDGLRVGRSGERPGVGRRCSVRLAGRFLR